MKFGNKNGPEVGKWFFQLSIDQDYWNRAVGWNCLYFALFKLKCNPQPGEAITRGKHHNGIQFTLYFWLPFYMGQ